MTTDHNPVVAKLRVKLNKVKKKKRVKKYRKNLNRDRELKENCALEVKNRYEILAQSVEKENKLNEASTQQQESLTGAANDLVPKEPQGRRQVWMTQEIWT